MAKTFTDLSGSIIELDTDYDIYTDFNQDILTDEITCYFIVIDDNKYMVDKRTYDAVTRYLENL
ncbi:hypothetical protein [Clostridium perfringens]|uniref:hypothetical protein n=1 Tax=Clostridium perfringens TaxID=1502 RepID=UPI001A1CE7B5|nr:hypothetical protein [Clostridium perfringens]HAT4108518.1 hypothetical protein [Clostridium perfringens]